MHKEKGCSGVLVGGPEIVVVGCTSHNRLRAFILKWPQKRKMSECGFICMSAFLTQEVSCSKRTFKALPLRSLKTNAIHTLTQQAVNSIPCILRKTFNSMV